MVALLHESTVALSSRFGTPPLQRTEARLKWTSRDPSGEVDITHEWASPRSPPNVVHLDHRTNVEAQ